MGDNAESIRDFVRTNLVDLVSEVNLALGGGGGLARLKRHTEAVRTKKSVPPWYDHLRRS